MKKLKDHHDGQDEDDFSSRQAAFQQAKRSPTFYPPPGISPLSFGNKALPSHSVKSPSFSGGNPLSHSV